MVNRMSSAIIMLTEGEQKLHVPFCETAPLLSVYYADYEDHIWALCWLMEYDL